MSRALLFAVFLAKGSGGLLISLPQKGLKKFDLIMKKEKAPCWVTGEVEKGRERIIVER